MPLSSMMCSCVGLALHTMLAPRPIRYMRHVVRVHLVLTRPIICPHSSDLLSLGSSFLLRLLLLLRRISLTLLLLLLSFLLPWSYLLFLLFLLLFLLPSIFPFLFSPILLSFFPRSYSSLVIPVLTYGMEIACPGKPRPLSVTAPNILPSLRFFGTHACK